MKYKKSQARKGKNELIGDILRSYYQDLEDDDNALIDRLVNGDLNITVDYLKTFINLNLEFDNSDNDDIQCYLFLILARNENLRNRIAQKTPEALTELEQRAITAIKACDNKIIMPLKELISKMQSEKTDE